MTYCLGRLPAVRPGALSDLAVYAHGKLPAPPSAVPVPKGVYPVDGNDQYGDCTIAGVAHMIQAWDRETGQKDPVPNAAEVEKTYFKLSGGDDTGLVEADVLKHWHREGLFGERIAGYAPVSPRDTLGIHQSVGFYGGAYLGIECPVSAQVQFAHGQPWRYVPGSPVAGGHCIVALGYTQTALLCATWGGVAEVTYGFLAHFLDEAWAILPNQLVEAKKDSLGIDLGTLQADLARL